MCEEASDTELRAFMDASRVRLPSLLQVHTVCRVHRQVQTHQGGGPESGIQVHLTGKLMLPQIGRWGAREERGPRPETLPCRRGVKNESEFAGQVDALGRRSNMGEGMESLNSAVSGVSGR